MKDILSERKKLDKIDKKMATLFEKRLAVCENIADIKRKSGADIEDKEREKQMIYNNSKLVCEKYREYYIEFLKNNINLSKKLQGNILEKKDVIFKRGILSAVSNVLNLERKVLIVTDTGVPKEYVNTVFSASKESYIFTFEEGENSKSFETVQNILGFMLDNGFSRSDCVIAVGGGVVGDVAGFAASIYMRGIEFYMIPTTTLSQIDSCIGGKTAVDFKGAKNTVGSFYFASKILIDPDTLKTLDSRNFNAGLAEAVKIGAVLNKKVLSLFEKGSIEKNTDEIIALCIEEKRKVVSADKTDKGIRHCLNFGHTIGHAIETVKGDLLHGECVAAGMLYVCSDEVKQKLKSIFEKLGLGEINLSKEEKEKVFEIMKKDKKIVDNKIDAVFCETLGTFKIERTELEEFKKRVNL